MWAGLPLAVLVSSCIIRTSSGQAIDPFDPSNVQAFVEKQILDFSSDCEAFVDSFTPEFDFDDTVHISDSKEELLAMCRENEGSVNEFRTTPSIKAGSVPSPSYNNIAVTGMQSICLDLGDGKGLRPVCFDFVLTEILKAREGAPFGLQSENWTGYYNILPETCPGIEPLVCPVCTDEAQ